VVASESVSSDEHLKITGIGVRIQDVSMLVTVKLDKQTLEYTDPYPGMIDMHIAASL
jgi:hypothetical protein